MIRTGCRLHATVEEITALIASSKPAAPAGGGPQLQQYQTEMLGKLRALRDSLDAERAPFVKMQAERDAAVSAKATLEEANEKMAYRIKHLMRAIDPEFAARQEASSAASSQTVDASLRKGSCLVNGKFV